MKMSDVFDLPLETNDHEYSLMDSIGKCPLNDCNGYEEEVAHAINSHDQLVDNLKAMCEMWEVVCKSQWSKPEHMQQYVNAKKLLSELESK